MNIFLFGLMTFLLIMDIVNTEIAIYKYKAKEKNPIMKIKYVRWFLNSIKVIFPIYLFIKTTFVFYFKFSDIGLLPLILWYFFICYHNLKVIKKKKRIIYIIPKQIKKYKIEV